MKNDLPRCARCSVDSQERLCRKENGKAPNFCPTKKNETIIAKALQEFKKPDVLEFAKQASIQEGEGYGDKDLGYDKARPIKPRIIETIEFAQKMSYKHLGFVFCIGLRKEARVFETLLTSKGFEVVSVACKLGREPKESIGILDEQKIRVGAFEAMCNPIAQAFVLNDKKTEFNIVMGLCVGHDSLFLKYSDSPCTVLAAKDRLLGHNPLSAIYMIDNFYHYVKY